MAAPNFQTLYDIPGQLDAAWKTAIQAALTAASLSAGVEITRESVEKPTPRIELTTSIGPAQSQRGAFGQANPKQVATAFGFAINLAVWSCRKIPTDDAEIHGKLVGLMIWTFSAGAKAIPASSLAYLQILDLQVQSVTPIVYDPKAQDGTEIVLQGIVAIRNDAWPSSP